MTMNDFRETLIQELSLILGDMAFYDCHNEKKPIKGYAQCLPPVMPDTPDAYTELLPYFVVRTKSAAFQEDGEEILTVKTRIILGVYDDPDSSGCTVLTTAMQKLTQHFRQQQAMGYYWCDKNMNIKFKKKKQGSHFVGVMKMTWHLPA